MLPLMIATTVLTESALSFLSIGVQPPKASWGTVIQDGQGLLYTRPWVAIAPGIMIVLTVLSLNVLGDGVRDALDPRGEGARQRVDARLHRQAPDRARDRAVRDHGGRLRCSSSPPRASTRAPPRRPQPITRDGRRGQARVRSRPPAPRPLRADDEAALHLARPRLLRQPGAARSCRRSERRAGDVLARLRGGRPLGGGERRDGIAGGHVQGHVLGPVINDPGPDRDLDAGLLARARC